MDQHANSSLALGQHRHRLFKIDLTPVEYGPHPEGTPDQRGPARRVASAMTVAGFGVIVVGFGIIGSDALAPLSRRSRLRLRAWVREHGSDGGDMLRFRH